MSRDCLNFSAGIWSFSAEIYISVTEKVTARVSYDPCRKKLTFNIPGFGRWSRRPNGWVMFTYCDHGFPLESEGIEGLWDLVEKKLGRKVVGFYPKGALYYELDPHKGFIPTGSTEGEELSLSNIEI